MLKDAKLSFCICRQRSGEFRRGKRMPACGRLWLYCQVYCGRCAAQLASTGDRPGCCFSIVLGCVFQRFASCEALYRYLKYSSALKKKQKTNPSTQKKPKRNSQ